MSFIIQEAASGGLIATAAGTINDLATVIVTASGTVQMVASTGSPQGVGSVTSFATGQVGAKPVACYDPTNQQVIVLFSDPANSNYTTAIVGTISGSTITFGSKYVVNSTNAGANNLALAYDTVNQKVLFMYQANFSWPYARVGTITGTTISLGSANQLVGSSGSDYALAYNPPSANFVWSSADNNLYNYRILGVATISGTSFSSTGVVGKTGNPVTSFGNLSYEPVSGKLIYSDRPNAGSANTISTGVLSVSGTTITQNTYYTFTAPYTNLSVMRMTAAGNNTFACIYTSTTSGGVYSVIGTLAGTVITYGSNYTNQASISVNGTGIAWDSTNSRVVYAWDGFMQEATISGTTQTLKTSLAVSGTAYMSLTFLPNVARVLNAYRGNANMDALTYKVDTLSTNLTATNFIGFADNAALTGENVIVNITGSVIEGLSGLTPATKYYVQYDGTLNTTADAIVGAVYAGLAVSSTKLIMNDS